jgi:hypothetical protein
LALAMLARLCYHAMAARHDALRQFCNQYHEEIIMASKFKKEMKEKNTALDESAMTIDEKLKIHIFDSEMITQEIVKDLVYFFRKTRLFVK